MELRARSLLNRFFDTGEAKTAFGRALLRERYQALQRQIPLLYAVALTNFLGLVLASRSSTFGLFHPANVLILFIVFRLVHWLRTARRTLAPEQIIIELRRTLVLSGMLSLGFCFWAIRLFGEATHDQQDIVILFAALAAIGCAYGLTSFPAAARLPLLLFALPFAARLTMSADPVHGGVGISLAFITLLILRLVNLHNDGFVRLVRSRSQVETERERAQRAERVALAEKARVRQVADTDALTGLANRRAFVAELEARLGQADAPTFAIALLDLDGFKPINDTFGHAAGDALLIDVSARLRHEAGGGSLVARIGGDEFGFIIPTGDRGALLKAGERLCAALGRPYRIDGREFRISACCGLALLAPGQCSVTLALSRGDAALYRGKQKGRGSFALFTAEIEAANQRRIAIERALREPVVRQEIGLAFQPIFDLDTGALRAFEALARWTHAELGPIGPAEFIPIAEQINVIGGITDALLTRAAREAASWPAAVRLSFNLSTIQLCSPRSAGRILRILGDVGVDPARLEIEVTETAMLADFETARLNLAALRAAGVRIVLDDFGAGFASISYLREMIFDTIKIDGTLVVEGARSEAGSRLLKGVLDLCASLNVPCVAEHIEEPAQLAMLRALNCRYGQGYALSPPLAAAEAQALAAAKLMPFPVRGEHSKVRSAA